MANAIHVVPYDDIWATKKEGNTRVSNTYDTKADAIEAAKRSAHKQGLDVVVHGRDGKIQRVIKYEDLSDDNCFITTACVKYYRLKDNCYQLETLREFRDNYLLKSKKGRALVEKYYHVAPLLVLFLEKDTHRKQLYKQLFNQINIACMAIENKEFKKAEQIYTKAVVELFNHFKPSL